jgi:hypothetical protein
MEPPHSREMFVSRPPLLRYRRRNDTLRLGCILSALDRPLTSTKLDSRQNTPGRIFLLRILYNHLLYHTHDRSPDGCEEWRFYQFDTVGSDRGLRGGTTT